MINFIRIEFLSFFTGFRELIYSIAEKVDYRMKSFKLSFRASLIETELDKAYIGMGKKALEKFSHQLGFSELNFDHFIQELREIQTLKDQYSQTLQELSDLQRMALKESLSQCTEQFQRSGWELAQIDVPRQLSFAKIRIKEIPVKHDFLMLMIKKNDQIVLVNGDLFLEGGDTVICIGSNLSLQSFKNFLQRA